MDNATIEDIKKTIEDCIKHQIRSVMDWHFGEPVYDDPDNCPKLTGAKGLRELCARLHWVNFRLWHVEDRARRVDLPDSVIVECKRTADRLNQIRNDLTEAMDECLADMLKKCVSSRDGAPLATETVGCALGRLSVIALRIYHLKEQTGRRDVCDRHKTTCSNLYSSVETQHQRLVEAVNALMDDYAAGRKQHHVHRFFKMYNDPELNPELYKNKQE